MLKSEEIQIRDPFVLADAKNKKYYLYGTTDKNCWKGKATGFDVYSSSDLMEWEGPFEAFRPDENFWADRHYWAPEVYLIHGRYYMFASFKAEGVHRGTQVLVSENPKGPFRPHSDGPITPSDWECLDGTLYIDDENQPWLIFCREWLQVCDGEMYAVKLRADFKNIEGEPIFLFKASEAPWTKGHPTTIPSMQGRSVYVTDGPFLYRTLSGQLLLLWSSGGKEGYAIGIARSLSGNISGPWQHEEVPLFAKDGGHGMLFKTFEGQVMLTIHSPNVTPKERPVFFKIKEENGQIKLH